MCCLMHGPCRALFLIKKEKLEIYFLEREIVLKQKCLKWDIEMQQFGPKKFKKDFLRQRKKVTTWH